MNRFIKTATHELRNPLISIKGYLGLIKMRLEKKQEMLELNELRQMIDIAVKKFVLMKDADMYIFQAIGCKYAENYHHSIKSGSFLCPFALFVGALIHPYMNPRIHISKTVLRRGGFITVTRS